MTHRYRHVDVFAAHAFTGNSLAVFPDSSGLSAAQMLAITQEVRHFESVFLAATDDPAVFRARVFDLFEELDFAGHPLLGAAAVLHERAGGGHEQQWTLRLPGRSVTVTTVRAGHGYSAQLDQGRPEFLGEVPAAGRPEIAAALGLPAAALAGLPCEVVSTGLRYLIVPVVGGLADAGISRPGFGELIGRYGAQFAYLLDVEGVEGAAGFEGRHWNNDGLLEDVATGSAAGCVGAYLARHELVPTETEFILQQGRFVGRPSRIRVEPQGRPDDLVNIRVGGQVAMVASGSLDRLPE